MRDRYTHMEYRNAKIIHIVNKGEEERFVYKNREITKEEVFEIMKRLSKRNEKTKEKAKEEVEL